MIEKYSKRPFLGKREDFIIGLRGCYCHPFSSWKELAAAEKQIFTVGEIVQHRCYDIEDKIKTVYPKNDPNQGFGYVVLEKFGLEHVQNLIKKE